MHCKYGIYKSGKRTFVCLSHTADTSGQYIFTRCVFWELPFVVLISREIVCQRGWRCLATGHAGVDKWLDYLRSDKKDVNQAKNPLSLTAVNFDVHKSTDGPIANYYSCWCHLSELKSSRTHPKQIRISVYMSITADYTTSSIPIRELYSDWGVYIWSFFIQIELFFHF